MQAALTESGKGTFEDRVSQYFTGRAEMERYLGPGDLLRDDRPITEYFLSLPPNQPPVDLTAYEGPREAIIRRP